MSFFDKLKQGVNDAGQKAKIAVEVNRVKLQIHALQKQMEEKQTSIGGMIYQLFQAGDPISSNAEIDRLCNDITLLQVEVKQLQVKQKEMNHEKECSCGKVIALDAKYCPFCGHDFTKQPEIIEISLETAPSNVPASVERQEEAGAKKTKTDSETKEA